MASQAPTEQINALLAQVKALGSSLNVAERATVQKALLTTLQHIETPYEHLLRLSCSHLQLACVRFGADLGLFKALVASETPLTVQALGKQLGAAPELLGRVLRLLASVDFITQPALDTFGSSKLTHDLAGEAMGSGVHLLFDIHNRTFQTMPDYFAGNKYRDVDDIRDGVFQRAFGTDVSCYEYLVTAPRLQGYMQDAMKLQPPGGDWLSVFPTDDGALHAADPGRALFVDIGGGMGHQCIRFRERFPDVPGRVVLQDMPITIGRVPSPMPHGIEAMPHDIDAPQPIKGKFCSPTLPLPLPPSASSDAKFYYLRNVLHGLPDAHAVEVLKQIIPVMNKDSRLVIDDIVVPDMGAVTQACQLDFIMMASIAGKKRTRDNWHKVIAAAGFKVLDIRPYDWPLQDSLIISSLA